MYVVLLQVEHRSIADKLQIARPRRSFAPERRLRSAGADVESGGIPHFAFAQDGVPRCIATETRVSRWTCGGSPIVITPGGGYVIGQLANDRITLARGGFEAFAVEDVDASSLVLNQADAL